MLLTASEEQAIIHKGRVKLLLLVISLFLLSFLFLSFRFEFAKVWVFRCSPRLEANVPYVMLMLSLVFFFYAHIEPFTLKIQRMQISLQNLPVRSLRIAQLSDLHVHFPYPQVTAKRLNDIIDRINLEQPDLVAVTGDLMSDDSKYASQDITLVINALRRLQAPTFVCFGNHDVARHCELVHSLQSIGAKTLEQETTEFEFQGSTIYISGLNPSLILSETVGFVSNLKDSFHGNAHRCHILLAHMPDAADAAADTGLFDLQLSGHSHGGQCVLPFNAGTPFLPPGSLKYHACVTSNYRIGDMILHVSRGIGVTPLPYPLIRFLCPPEISILTLVGPSC
jgi:predicted MPP superfamily phosphohydrolase